MVEVTESIDVPAPPAVVWEILTDIEAYPQWNTLLSVTGDLAVGNAVSATLSVPGLPTVPFSPEITEIDPERELRWESTIFGFNAEHAFLLEPTDAGTTRFVQREWITGPFASTLVSGFERRMRRGFEQMNVGLRRRAIELTER